MLCRQNKGRNRVHVYQLDDELVQQRGEKCNGYHGLQKRWKRTLPPVFPANCANAQTETKSEHCGSFCAWRMKPAKSSPMAFIPAAERYQLMHLIDRWVISRFCPFGAAIPGNLALLRDAECPVSMPSTCLALVLMMNSLLILCRNLRSAVSPSIICFEITETVAITNLVKPRSL